MMIDIKKIANLARLNLREDELAKLSDQLPQILGYVETLSQLDLTNVKPTSHAVSVSNVFREDVAHLSGIIDDAIKAAPECSDHLFQVPKVIE